jgi:putative colanic acid biosysnthesis UDP-glucose lipid carrier transferase
MTIKPIRQMQTNYQTLSAPHRLSPHKKKSPGLRRFVDNKPLYFFVKRIFDIVFSILVIVLVLTWSIPLLAVIIKIDSRGPVFFLQRRTGRGGRMFYCIKFRTMTHNIQADFQSAVANDSRVTAAGRFLRRSCIDELPQFLNVLAGQMSVIGPRPHMISDCNRFAEVIAGYKFRNLVKPGITGLAQVKGCRGPSEEFSSILRRFQYDAFYVRNINFWLDLRIVRITASQVLLCLLKRNKLLRAVQQKNSDKYKKIAA